MIYSSLEETLETLELLLTLFALSYKTQKNIILHIVIITIVTQAKQFEIPTKSYKFEILLFIQNKYHQLIV